MALLILSMSGLAVLYSASGGDIASVQKQLIRLSVGFAGLLIFAHIPSDQLGIGSLWLYLVGVGLLVLVLVLGDIGKGAQRWLDLGFVRFQPSELMKIWLPMMMAWYYAKQPLPPTFKDVLAGLAIVAVPAALIVQQPDLGTAILVTASGVFVIFLAGIRFRIIALFAGLLAVAAPALWFYLHDYQRNRILTLINPESDPLGAGYHIIQSKIAIGSGELVGKGYLKGTQSKLQFLPKQHTDFVFSNFAEEFGFLGAVLVIGLYASLAFLGLAASFLSKDGFGMLVAFGMTTMITIQAIINLGMEMGLLPVWG